MARTNNLTNFLTDVSAAIKQKIGDNTPIPATNFDTEILSIETAGNYQSKTLNVTQNGNYNLLPDQDYDAMSNVNISVNVPTGEDLDAVITTQEQKLNELERVLQSKGSWEVIPNIYVQEMEPLNKNGIWLKMSDNTYVDNFISDDNIFIGGTWALDSETANIPYAFYSGSAVTIGTDIYLLGSYGNGCNQYNYKYDTLTNTYTKLTDIPFPFFASAAVAVGTDIYLLGAYESSYRKYNYKYDTLTNTYTKLTDIPYDFYDGSAVAVGTDIYLLGGYSSNSNERNKNYKYDTLTNTYTQLTNIPFSFHSGSAVTIGTDIYILGSSNSSYNQYNYKYDTVNNTYTQLTNIPYAFYSGSAVTIGTDIYLLGAYESSYRKYNYKYDTLTNTYTKLTDIPYDFYDGSAVAVGTDIYLLGGQNNTNINRIYHVESKTYSTDNSVIIAQGRTYSVGYNTKLFETPFDQNYQPLYGFADAYFYTIQDGLDGSMPVYYGDGTQWINIKNPPTEGGNE